MAKKRPAVRPRSIAADEPVRKTYRVLGEAPVQVDRIDYYKGEEFTWSFPAIQEDQLVSHGIIEVVRERATATDTKRSEKKKKQAVEEAEAAAGSET